MIKTKEKFIEQSKEIFGESLDYSKVDWINTRIKVILICKKHGEFNVAPHVHLGNKSGCSYCSGSKYNTEIFIEKSKAIFGNTIDYSKINYKNSRDKVIFICPQHGEFTLSPAEHLSYKRGCHVCSGVRHNKDSFIEKAIQLHGNLFNYDKVVFKDVKQKVIIGCEFHGDFLQSPYKHIQGQKCPKCSKTYNDAESFIKRAVEVHSNKYNYSKCVFINSNERVEIICSKHGSFWQYPGNHINYKRDCEKCSQEGTRITKEDFIERANIVHDNKYDYSQLNYVNAETKVDVICQNHGLFKQKPFTHLGGAGCNRCTLGGTSKVENEWLDFLNIPNNFRSISLKTVNKIYRVDAYDPSTNTIYEFYGDYWHGNPKIYPADHINKHNKQTFGSLYEKTMKRHNELISLGYSIVHIWEKDFKELKKKS